MKGADKTSIDTKTRLLDVAERLFAEQGLDRVSIRDITDGADENVAAVSYHFGGKNELIAAVFERRVAPVNKARLAELMQVEAQAGRKAPKVEAIIEAFVRPAVANGEGDKKGAKTFAKLFGRCLSEAHPDVEKMLKAQFQPVVDLMEKLFLRALPHLSRTDIFWRLKFTFGALHHWSLTRDKWLPEFVEKTDVEEQMQKLISFAAAGFKDKSIHEQNS